MFACFTDFGFEGPYVGQMKARLMQLAPDNPVLDLMHDVPAFDIASAGQLLCGLYDDLPKGTIYLCIIDPGVGGARRPVYIKCQERYFIGPDNGLFQPLIEQNPDVVAYEILWRPEKLSVSFHGRDLFAPIAAKLYNHHPFEQKEMSLHELYVSGENKARKIIYIDGYGNGWTGLRHKDVTENSVLIFNQSEINYQTVFCNTPVGELFWYFNSSGFVEIACNQASAKDKLGFTISDEIIIKI